MRDNGKRLRTIQAVFTVRNLFGRYTVARLNCAVWRVEVWNGSQWMSMRSKVHVPNFGSHQEAESYARRFGFAIVDRIVQQRTAEGV